MFGYQSNSKKCKLHKQKHLANQALAGFILKGLSEQVPEMHLLGIQGASTHTPLHQIGFGALAGYSVLVN